MRGVPRARRAISWAPSGVVATPRMPAARWTMVESLAAGVTTMAATEASGASAAALTEAGLRGVVYQEVFGPDPAQVEESMNGLLRDLEQVRALQG